jgi:hypothetical protein
LSIYTLWGVVYRRYGSESAFGDSYVSLFFRATPLLYDRASVKIKKSDPRNPAPSTLSQKNARSTVVNWHKPLSRADSDSETTMAEPELDATAPAPPRWLTNADQVEQKHDEAVAVAVAKCADETPPPL